MIRPSSRFYLSALALFLGGWLIHNSQNSEAQPSQANKVAAKQKASAILYEKRFSDGSHVFLTSRSIAFKKPTLAEIHAQNPQVPAHRLREVPQPDGAREFNLMFQDANAPARVIWSLQQVEINGRQLAGNRLQILDVVRDDQSFIVVWRYLFGVAINILEKTPLKRNIGNHSTPISLFIQENEIVPKWLSKAGFVGSLSNDTLSMNLKWSNGTKSSWAYRKGKWIETVKYVQPPDPNILYQQQQLHKVRLEREELRRSLVGQPKSKIERKMKRFDRIHNLLPPGTPELTHAEARADYRDSLENMTAAEIEAEMKGWEFETTPHKP